MPKQQAGLPPETEPAPSAAVSNTAEAEVDDWDDSVPRSWSCEPSDAVPACMRLTLATDTVLWGTYRLPAGQLSQVLALL